MSRVSIWAQLEAKPGKEKEVEEFLKSAQPLAERDAALTAGVDAWAPGERELFVRIVPSRITGRRISPA